ncbi:uncharacterized protein EV154DRAFT_502992 [Mucor mucedo]|uniref:uncharacterized protein n=1 Tax=Mucor mucedo TaxID=29922 RepID=UPI00221EB5E9|nr:uncharacterized protein EV154DRAFT_502992 [Mucor mucedo]KAI7893007.1 hypothetical protein EV154DRAFT_502992 [Mucor mucedo]
MKLFSIVTIVALPALISAARENCVSNDIDCSVNPCCPGFDCSSETQRCIPERPKKFCKILGLTCGPDSKKCCPDTSCDAVTGRCVIDP